MPNISAMRDSNFLKKDEVDPPVLVTVEGVHQLNVAKQGAPEELKWCIKFHEHEKPMVLNSTNAQIIAKITGSEETDEWVGKKVVLYNDPNISFGGKITGGIRCRAPKTAKPAVAAPKSLPIPQKADSETQSSGADEDCPF